jgi:hypothetical protein
VEFVLSLVGAAALIYALVRERSRKRRTSARRQRSSDWSPCDRFYSDRPHWLPPDE